MILGLETSCDETSAAVVTGDGRVLSNVVSSQADLHARYGGVVIEIRDLELSDLIRIEEIEKRAYPTPWSRSMFAGELAKPSSICLGAFDSQNGGLVGYLIISRYVDAWHVMNVAVAPEHRRQGIAGRLLCELFDRTGAEDRRGYTLEVRVSNSDAIALYEKLGFRSHGVRRGYYTDNREDALIMWRDPEPPAAA